VALKKWLQLNEYSKFQWALFYFIHILFPEILLILASILQSIMLILFCYQLLRIYTANIDKIPPKL